MEWKGTTYEAWNSEGDDCKDGWYCQFLTGCEIVGSIGPFKTEEEAMRHMDTSINKEQRRVI